MENREIRKEIRKILEENFLKEQEVKMKFNIDVPDDIMKIKDVFQKNGFDIFLVGGCVRDALLEKEAKDFDLVTNVIPDKVIEILKGQPFVKNILETGKSFGVINVVTDSDMYEIATMRKDIGSSDSRRPDSVEFTDMKTDSERRDISYNALYYDIAKKEIIDFTGGIEDLKNKLTRTVGRPEDRFGEDKLRILRIIRFSARFGSELDHSADAALRKDSNIEGISGERIRDEFIKGIKSAKSVKHFLELLQRYNLFKWIFGNLLIKERSMQSLDLIEERDVPVLIAYLLSDNNVDSLRKELNNLKYSSDEVAQISFLVGFKRLSIENAFKMKKAQANSKLSDEQIYKFAQWMKMDMNLAQAFLKFQPSVSGNDLISQGFKGKELGSEIERIETENFLNLLK